MADLRAPAKIDATPAGDIVFLEREGRVQVWRSPQPGTGYERRHAFTVPPASEDLCVAGERIFVRAWTPDGLLHEYSTEGKRTRSFAPGYAGSTARSAEKMSVGVIGCIPEASLVVVVYRYLPYVEAYSFSGERVWVAKFTDFAPTIVTEDTTTGTIRYNRAPAHDVPVSVTPLGGASLLYQHSRLLPRTDASVPRARELHGYVLDARTGHGQYVGDSIGVAVASWSTGLVAFVDDYPPRSLTVYQTRQR